RRRFGPRLPRTVRRRVAPGLLRLGSIGGGVALVVRRRRVLGLLRGLRVVLDRVESGCFGTGRDVRGSVGGGRVVVGVGAPDGPLVGGDGLAFRARGDVAVGEGVGLGGEGEGGGRGAGVGGGAGAGGGAALR